MLSETGKGRAGRRSPGIRFMVLASPGEFDERVVVAALELLEARGAIVVERGRVRVRDRHLLRYYAHTLDHLLASPSRRTH